MPRQARIVIAGEFYHVTQRGNYRQNIFEDNVDRINYLKLLDRYSQKYGLRIYAYCLMDNHVHFIVCPMDEGALAETFCRAHQRYSMYMHSKTKLRGHLWQERFYSCLLQGNHVLGAIRYVERNPVRAKMVKKPWEYEWSSATEHLGKKNELIIISLSDITEYLETVDWKEYLMEEEIE